MISDFVMQEGTRQIHKSHSRRCWRTRMNVSKVSLTLKIREEEWSDYVKPGLSAMLVYLSRESGSN